MKRFLTPILIFLLALSGAAFAEQGRVLINDVSRLNPTFVKEIYTVRDEEGLREKILEAKRLGLKISMAGQKHSQGGHQFSEGGLVLDMLQFNRILSLDKENKVIKVQSGATWDQIQRYINPFGLALKVMQTSNIFTVGGSISLNIHGRDPNYSTIHDCVKSFRLMLSDGNTVNASRTENSELFNLVIGGMGLFGVILDVDIELTDDVVYEKHTRYMDYKEYFEFFQKEIKNNKEVGLHGAALSIAPGKTFLKELSATIYRMSVKKIDTTVLVEEKYVIRNKFLLDLSRKFSFGKKLCWFLQIKLEDDTNGDQPISRNNAMRQPIKFLEYHSKQDTDILQEYFIPVYHFASFIDGLREFVMEERINLLHVGIRYVPEDKKSVLSYAPKDVFSIVLYLNQQLSQKEIEKAKIWTKKLVDLAIENEGSYYLAYQLFSTRQQLKMAYPNIDKFFEKKKHYDPELRFTNRFYEQYK